MLNGWGISKGEELEFVGFDFICHFLTDLHDGIFRLEMCHDAVEDEVQPLSGFFD